MLFVQMPSKYAYENNSDAMADGESRTRCADGALSRLTLDARALIREARVADLCLDLRDCKLKYKIRYKKYN